MQSPIKMTGQGIRDLNDTGPKKKPPVPTASVEPAAGVETAPAVSTPSAEDATTPAVVQDA